MVGEFCPTINSQNGTFILQIEVANAWESEALRPDEYANYPDGRRTVYPLPDILELTLYASISSYPAIRDIDPEVHFLEPELRLFTDESEAVFRVSISGQAGETVDVFTDATAGDVTGVVPLTTGVRFTYTSRGCVSVTIPNEEGSARGVVEMEIFLSTRSIYAPHGDLHTLRASLNSKSGASASDEIAFGMVRRPELLLAEFPDRLQVEEDVPYSLKFEYPSSQSTNEPFTLKPKNVQLASGSLELAGFVLKYVPEADWHGDAGSFELEACNQAGDCAEKEVQVIVTPVQDDDAITVLPIDRDSLITVQGQSTTIRITITDLDAGARKRPIRWTVSSVNGWQAGAPYATGTVDTDSGRGMFEFTYTPQGGFVGIDSFIVELEATHVGTARIEHLDIPISVAVRGEPIAKNDEVSVLEDETVSIDVLANDSDPEGGDLVLLSTTGYTPHLDVRKVGNRIHVKAKPGSGGKTETFHYTIKNQHGLTATGKVTVDVESRNQSPTALDDGSLSSPIRVDQGDSITIDVLGNDTDPDGDTLRIVDVGQSTYRANIQIRGNTIWFKSRSGIYDAIEKFEYTIEDEAGEQSTATVTVYVRLVNLDPIARTDRATTNAGQSVTVKVLRNDLDLDGDDIWVVGVFPTSQGTVRYSRDSVTFTPKSTATGTVRLTYTIRDEFGATDRGTIRVTVKRSTSTSSSSSSSSSSRSTSSSSSSSRSSYASRYWLRAWVQ